MNRTHILLTAALIIIAFNALILQKERFLATGESIYFELAPVDPRSLMQGDYMQLQYKVAEDIQTNRVNQNNTQLYGLAIVLIDDNNIAHFQNLETDKTPLKPNQRHLKWRTASLFPISIGAPSYFFQEGRAEHFQQAKYAEIKLAPAGSTLLVGLLDHNKSPL